MADPGRGDPHQRLLLAGLGCRNVADVELAVLEAHRLHWFPLEPHGCRSSSGSMLHRTRDAARSNGRRRSRPDRGATRSVSWISAAGCGGGTRMSSLRIRHAHRHGRRTATRGPKKEEFLSDYEIPEPEPKEEDEKLAIQLRHLADNAVLKGRPSGDERCENCRYYLEPSREISYCWHPKLRILVGDQWWCQWWEANP